MRILFVSNIFPNPLHPTKGTFNFELLRTLARAHDVSVVSPIPWVQELPLVGNPLRRGERRVALEGMDVHYPRYYYTPRVGRRFYGEFYWRSIKRTAMRLGGEWQPDVVLSYWAHPDGDAATRLARALGVPSVVMIGGSDVLLFTADASRRALIVKSLLRADRIMTVSRHLQHSMEALGVPAPRISVVYRGVDRARFCPGSRRAARAALDIPPDARVAVWIGRMVPVKGLEALLEAAQRAKASGAPVRVYLIGTGPLRRQLEADAARRGLRHDVAFVGAVSHRDLAPWYRAADFTVLPSLSEGVPNVLLESIACGTPFIASSVGGIPEIADERLDCLVPAGDAAALASAMAVIADSPSTGLTRRFVPRDARDVGVEISTMLHDLYARRSPGPLVVGAPAIQVN